jgi:hypothetical protein
MPAAGRPCAALEVEAVVELPADAGRAARPDKVRREGLFELRVAGLAEVQWQPNPFAVAQVDGGRGPQVQVVRNEAQDAQQP